MIARTILSCLLILSILATPPGAHAQQVGRVARVGVLLPSTPAPWVEAMRVFRQRLRELGWIEGQNLILDFRYADNKNDRLPVLAAELVAMKPDAIFAGASAATRAAIRATTTIPIVFETLGDAVSSGLVPDLAHPGGNVTGVSGFSPELAAKQLQLLREIVPGAARVAVLTNQDNVSTSAVVRALETAARKLEVQINVVDVRNPSQLEGAFERMARQGAEALVVVSDPMLVSQSGRIVGLVTRHRLPAAFEMRDFPDAGGLLSYGPSKSERWQQAALYVHRILGGAKAADLPIEQPTKFALIVNLKSAKALGLTIPPSVLVRADEIIQ